MVYYMGEYYYWNKISIFWQVTYTESERGRVIYQYIVKAHG
jgi:hypothetical protein